MRRDFTVARSILRQYKTLINERRRESGLSPVTTAKVLDEICESATRFNDCNNWQVMAGGKRVLFSNRMYERFSDVKSGIVATINVCENSGSVTDKAMLEGAKVMMQVLDGYPSFAALAAHPKRITG